MGELRTCPKCRQMTLYRFTDQTVKNTGKVIESLSEETYWKCMFVVCGHKE